LSKVLIVDDSKISRKNTRRALEDLDHEVLGEAVDGVDGIEKFKEFRPELIVTDIEMPKLDGIKMLKQIRSIDNHVKVVVVSSVVNAQAMQEVTKLYASIVKKPLKKERLENAIKLLTR